MTNLCHLPGFEARTKAYPTAEAAEASAQVGEYIMIDRIGERFRIMTADERLAVIDVKTPLQTGYRWSTWSRKHAAAIVSHGPDVPHDCEQGHPNCSYHPTGKCAEECQ